MAKNSIDVVLRLRGAAAYNKQAQGAAHSTEGIGKAGTKAERGLKRTERQANRTARGFHGLSRGAKLGIGAIGGAAALGAAKNAISSTVGLTKTTMGLQRATKMDTESASRWAAQAKVRGIDATALNMSMGTLSKNMTLAGEGGKSQIKAFDRLGISQARLKATGGDISKLLPVMADRFKSMGPSAQRTASMMALMGRGWQKLTPLMAGGSKEMNASLKLADKYGVTLHGKPLKSMNDLMQTQREMQLAQLGWQVQFSTQIAPRLIKGFRWILGVSNALRPGFRWLSRHATFSKVIVSAAVAAVAIRKVPGGVWLAKHILGGLGTLGAKLFVRLVGPEKAASVAAGRIAGNAGGAKIGDATASTLGKRTGRFKGVGTKLGKAFGGAFAAGVAVFAGIAAGYLATKLGGVIDDLAKRITGLDQKARGKWARRKVPGVGALQDLGKSTGVDRFAKKHLGFRGNALGGMIPRGGVSWVGERGPELAIAGQSGTRIMPSPGSRVPQLQGAINAHGGAGGGDVVIKPQVVLNDRVLAEAIHRYDRATLARK